MPRTPRVHHLALVLGALFGTLLVAVSVQSTRSRGAVPDVAPAATGPKTTVTHSDPPSARLAPTRSDPIPLDDGASTGGRSASVGTVETIGATGVPEAFETLRVTRPLPIRAAPGSGRTLGTLEPTSKYLGTATYAWIMRRSDDDRFGLVTVPYSGSGTTGWVRLDGAQMTSGTVIIRASLSRREIVAWRAGRVVLRAPVGIGSAATPTPTGRYFVTDMVRTGSARNTGPYGHLAFGLSGVQTHLPSGWTGGDQLAIHGTGNPGSIGRAMSTGCLRVSAGTLDRLRRLLQLGTPVVIER